MNAGTPRVFITQESDRFDYGQAEHFGEVVFLTAKEVSPIHGSLINATILEEMSRKLATFDFDKDFLTPSGSPVVTGIAFFMLGKRVASEPALRNAVLSVLRWSNRDRVYQPVPLAVGGPL